MDDNLAIVMVKNSRESEEGPLSMEQIFAAIGASGSHGGLLRKLFGPKSEHKFFSFEIVAVRSSIYFFVCTAKSLMPFLESQLTAHYPNLLLQEAVDYVPNFYNQTHVTAQMILNNWFYYPLKTYKDLKDVDMMSSLLGQLAKLPAEDSMLIQYRIESAGSSWQHAAASIVAKGVPDPFNPQRPKPHPHARMIEAKASQPGLLTSVRLVCAAGNETRAKSILSQIAGSFGVYALGEGNSLVLSESTFWQRKKLEEAIVMRKIGPSPKNQILTAGELASLWHPPGLTLAAIKNIAWGARMTSNPPENLPVTSENEDEKKEINFFARTEFKNKNVTFGIKRSDRRKHMYVIGKTGTGKSTMIANMAINDMRNGEGMAIIDPHGDLSDVLLDYVPSYRINDVAYLDPADIDYPFRINPFEVKNQAFRELVASGIVSIFYKLYHYSWGPRLEYILRNTILTLLSLPQTTMLQIPELLTNEKYRSRAIEKLNDPVLRNFWLNEFNRMSPQLQSEAISPILNKVGQFLSSQTTRNILGHPVSTINLEDFMNQGKILIVNLSQGKLGEDNSALLGAMIITKLQLAAMNRVYQSEESRRDFYLYVDEFQNFATSSFIKILSEARKYRLNIVLANQYVGQIDEDVQKAIFGNAGSLLSFAVGAADARNLTREFGSIYKEEELVNLGNYQIAVKLSIDNQTSNPFVATTLPLPRSHNQNREKVLRSSRERYAKKSES